MGIFARNDLKFRLASPTGHFPLVGTDNHLVIPRPPSGGVVLQMDQGAPADEEVFRLLAQRDQGSDLGDHFGLYTLRHTQKWSHLDQSFLQAHSFSACTCSRKSLCGKHLYMILTMTIGLLHANNSNYSTFNGLY